MPESVWSFHIGGYQVCEKWLKDRKSRKHSKKDIAHYQKVVLVLAETIRVMDQIDEVIEAHRAGLERSKKRHQSAKRPRLPVQSLFQLSVEGRRGA